ncbi:sorting nexin-20 isoform X2 [Electrophorus electricus]|uniref:sorting nexin-20 isoform X2 n=1 Tax=Electrophorus electricus TaxID=8005 RepID=UPI000F0A3141|nr:sorting nexin-20 isoform X2 [Electrophorus electricus]
MDSESQLLDLRTGGETDTTYCDDSMQQHETSIDAGFSASCLTTGELQQHWRAVKQNIRSIKVLFEIPSARIVEHASSRYVQLLQDFSEELEEVTLPKKKLVRNFSEENIAERRVALCDYLTQLYARCYVRRSPTFIAFFTHPELKISYDLLRGGRFSHALEALQSVLVLQEKLSIHDPALLVPTMCALVVCHRDLGNLDRAFQTGHRALPTMRRYGLCRYHGPLLEAMVDLGYQLANPVAQLQDELIKMQNSPHGPVSMVTLKELVVQEFT